MDMTEFSFPFNHDQPLLIDGALATELEARGADIDDPLWSAYVLLDDPDLIRQVHADYFAAGADIAITATYQATFEGFAQRGLDRAAAADLMRRAVRLADEARDEFWKSWLLSHNPTSRVRPLVAISIGPYGAFLADGSEYTGHYKLPKSALIDFHRPRMALLAEMVRAGEADLLACETIPCRVEAEALVDLLAEFGDVPAWIAFSCKDGERVCYGEFFEECVEFTASCKQVAAVGINCTPPCFVSALLRCAQKVTSKPLLVYPNRGEKWDAANHAWIDGSGIDDFGVQVAGWHKAGARLLGGCCRSTPADIRAMRMALVG